MADHFYYFDWLVDMIDDGRANRYGDLLHALFNTPYIWSIDNDGNREEDGYALRRKFVYEEGDHFYARYANEFNDFCSCLEVFIALADRMEDILYDPDYGCQTPKWFWLMISNLGLDLLDDEHFESFDYDQIMSEFLERTYDENGQGSIFMTTSTTFNFRKMELWYQMQTFLNENFEN